MTELSDPRFEEYVRNLKDTANVKILEEDPEQDFLSLAYDYAPLPQQIKGKDDVIFHPRGHVIARRYRQTNEDTPNHIVEISYLHGDLMKAAVVTKLLPEDHEDEPYLSLQITDASPTSSNRDNTLSLGVHYQEVPQDMSKVYGRVKWGNKSCDFRLSGQQNWDSLNIGRDMTHGRMYETGGKLVQMDGRHYAFVPQQDKQKQTWGLFRTVDPELKTKLDMQFPMHEGLWRNRLEEAAYSEDNRKWLETLQNHFPLRVRFSPA